MRPTASSQRRTSAPCRRRQRSMSHQTWRSHDVSVCSGTNSHAVCRTSESATSCSSWRSAAGAASISPRAAASSGDENRAAWTCSITAAQGRRPCSPDAPPTACSSGSWTHHRSTQPSSPVSSHHDPVTTPVNAPMAPATVVTPSTTAMTETHPRPSSPFGASAQCTAARQFVVARRCPWRPARGAQALTAAA